MIRSANATGGGDVTTEDWPLPVPAETTIFRELPEGGVLFSTASEVYFGVNAVGVSIWELLPPASRSFNDLCDRLASRYTDVDGDTIRGDARQFIEDLVSSGLVVSAPPEESSSDAAQA